MKNVDTLLKEKNIVLPHPALPLANYRPYIISGGLLIISGQLPLAEDGQLAAAFCGKIGTEVSPETGYQAARQCALNILAHAHAALGGLDAITQCLRLGGFIQNATDFHGLASVMNGASDLMVEIFGEAGLHARSTIGVAGLPLNACVEVEAQFAFDPIQRML